VSGNGEEGGGGQSGSAAGGVEDASGGVGGETAPLHLTVSKVRGALRRGHLVVRAHCDASCRLTVRGRLRATAAGHHRGATIRFARKRIAPAGAQRIRIPIPRRLTRWLRQAPPPKRLRAKLHFLAIDTQGRSAAVHTTLRLRVPRH